MAAILHNGTLIGDRDEINFVDGQPGQSAFAIADNQSANRVEVSVAGGSGGGSLISNSNGSASIDSSGNLVISGHVSSISGKPVGVGDINGVVTNRLSSSRVYTGTDISNNALYTQTVQTFDVQWYLVTAYAVVINPATTGSLKLSFQYEDASNLLQMVDVIGGAAGPQFDITALGNHAYGDICVPIHGNPNPGIFYWILGIGVTGTPQVNIYFLVEEK